MKKPEIHLELLGDKHSLLIPGAYIPIFEGHPWHEEFECICGTGPYSLGCDDAEKQGKGKFECDQFQTGKLFEIKNEDQECRRCGRPLGETLNPIFTVENVVTDYQKTIKRPGFLGVGAFRFGKLVGLCWGYNFPTEDKDNSNVDYVRVAELLEKEGIDPNKTFYHNESGTLPRHRNLGIGTELLKELLLRTSKDHESVAFRTINPAMARCYEHSFGIEKGTLLKKALFDDPNPNKRQKWFVLKLKDIK